MLVTYSCPKEKMRCGSQVTVVEANANATLFHKLSVKEQQQIQKIRRYLQATYILPLLKIRQCGNQIN